MPELPRLLSATLGDQAYAAVRDAILSGSLERGSKVTERGLAESLNISPTPVREALRRLEQDRLVERVGPRAVRIARFEEPELLEITMIEDALRALSARLAATNATDEHIASMAEVLGRAEDMVEAYGRDIDPSQLDAVQACLREFHTTLDVASGSPTLIHMLRMVDAFSSDERRSVVLGEIGAQQDVALERFKQHRLIFEAIAARDPDEAERTMRVHSRDSNDSRLAARGA